jgi:hypothetical protein
MRQRLAVLVFVDYEPTVITQERAIREVRLSIGFGHPDVIPLDPDQVGRMLLGELSSTQARAARTGSAILSTAATAGTPERP